MGLFAELQRRNVFRVALAYGVIAWVLAQVADLAFDNFGSPEWVSKTVLFLLLLGLPLAIAHLQSGDKQKSLATLRVVIDAGWRVNWWHYFDHHPALEPLRDDPEFQALRAEIAADMAEQLKNVRKKPAPPT